MPNWCDNKVTITGNPERLQDLVALLEGKESLFDFNRIFEEPKELEDICSGYSTIDGIKYKEWRETPNGNVGIETAEKALLIKRFGTATSIDWHIKNWGTKWNTGRDQVMRDVTIRCVIYSFNTAWCPPEPIFVRLQEIYPSLGWEWEYEEEGQGEGIKYLNTLEMEGVE